MSLDRIRANVHQDSMETQRHNVLMLTSVPRAETIVVMEQFAKIHRAAMSVTVRTVPFQIRIQPFDV